MATQKPPLQLTLANLHLLDGGKANAAVNHAIQQAVRDVQDRPGDKAVRAVTVEIKLKPMLDESTGILDTVDAQFLIKSKIPHRQTTQYPMLPTASGVLVFQEDTPMDPRQVSFDFTGEIDKETGEVITPAGDDDDPPDTAEV